MEIRKNKGETKLILPIIIVITIILVVLFFIVNGKMQDSKITLEVEKATQYEYFIMYSSDNKVGVVDKTGNVVIEPKYTEIYIPNPEKDVFFCYEEEIVEILNKKAEKLFEEFEEVVCLETSEATELVFEKKVLRYKKDDLYGLINYEGEVLTEAIYEKITSLKYKPGNLLAKKDDLCGVLNTDGEIIIPIKYEDVVGDEYCQEEYGYILAGYIVSVKTDTGIMYGYIDYLGNEVLKPEYEIINRAFEYDNTNDIYIIARSAGRRGVFKNGKQIIDFKYQSISYSDKADIFIVEKTGKYGFFDNEGEEILETKYTNYDIAGDYISVQENNLNKLYDLNGNLINENKYTSMIDIENSSYFIAINEAGYYNIISKEVQTDEKYIYLEYAFEDYFIFVNEENKTGVLNVWSGAVIEPIYDIVLNIAGTKLIEARNEETGEVDIYNYEMTKILTVSDGIVENIDENYTVIYSQTERFYINNQGDIVENTQVFLNNKLFAIKQNDKWGFVDETGKIVVECIYDMVTEIDEYGFAGIVQAGLWGVINEKGEIIVSPSYEIETYYYPSFVGKYLLEYTDTLHCVEIAS